jgi:hypothetical protein
VHGQNSELVVGRTVLSAGCLGARRTPATRTVQVRKAFFWSADAGMIEVGDIGGTGDDVASAANF